MRKLNLFKRPGIILAIALLSAFAFGLNSCNNSSDSSETKDTTVQKMDTPVMQPDTNKMMQKDTTKSEQVPPPK